MTIFYRESPLTFKVNSRDIPITHDQWELFQFDTRVIQLAFPFLSESDREYLLTGYTDEDWDAEFGEGNEVEEDIALSFTEGTS